jgi:hypothetical protein
MVHGQENIRFSDGVWLDSVVLFRTAVVAVLDIVWQLGEGQWAATHREVAAATW